MNPSTRRRYPFTPARLDKVLFPAEGLTKGDVLDYYEAVADVALPHVRNRPLAFWRFPDGITAPGFMQQHRPDYFPRWVASCAVPQASGRGTVDRVLCNNRSTLAYLADQAAISLHGWPARVPQLARPDRLVFDLDPAGKDFETVRYAARSVIDLMQTIGLNPFAMTTGSRGLHVVAPIQRGPDFKTVRLLAQQMAAHLAANHPENLTTAQRLADRRGRLYLDTTRNAYGQHTVMPYSLRPLPGAPVATPIERDELDDPELHARRWHLRNLPRRLAARGDPWAGMGRRATRLEKAQRLMAALHSDDPGPRS